QLGDDLFASGFFLQWKECAERVLIAHVRRVAIQNAAHFYNGASKLNLFAKSLRAIRRRKNGSANVEPQLSPGDIEGGHDLNSAWAVAADLPVHQPDASTVDGGAVVKIESLDKRAGAVSNADNGDSYFSHF